MASEARSLGFRSMELGHEVSPALMPGIYETHEKNNKRTKAGKRPRLFFSGIYKYCPSPSVEVEDQCDAFEFASPNSHHRNEAIQLTKKSIDLIAELNGDYVVLPIGYAPIKNYTGQLASMVSKGKLCSKSYAALKLEMIREREKSVISHLDLVRQALDEIIPYAQEKGIRLGLESCADYEQVPNEGEIETLLAEHDTPTVGYWHNFGHIQMKDNLGLLDHRQWLEKMLPRLIGCSVHDVIWPAEDLSIPFHGDIDFDQLIPLLPRNIPLVWTMNPGNKSDDIRAALIKWKEKYGD